ncbi:MULTISPECIES: inner membrane protein YbjM [Edwardsiella]|uniref:Inner membrane protein n=2 Tax=Edwardsiella anguillarum TaxID=1821960 RepID=A0A076LEV0_9GAMM|nr:MULTISPECIES: inner membrane protein YbjM [Edwardsiella]AKM47473.1 membrane protein [Edwardsiella sp. EA181011]AIJ06716.1 Hypothetical protein ETEE_0236 [Edwardsiella anguillarum ET080813]AKR78216.1 inner membrane protein YbjM [Edwardsiella sp. LADL05-105]KAB0593341.1 hypothetical protein F7P84_01035 [Edwardsiella anguillarum]RFT02364.1 hypothetical protein CGL57_13420 [Edwardsiella anguillarum]
MANGRRWFTLILCFLMVTALFLLSHSYTQANGGIAEPPGVRPGLLLYMLPGFILCPLARRQRVLTVFCGALASATFCQLLHMLWLADDETPLQLLPYTASMVFWCVFGALLYWFAATLCGQRAVR